jgi:hypothetical protein
MPAQMLITKIHCTFVRLENTFHIYEYKYFLQVCVKNDDSNDTLNTVKALINAGADVNFRYSNGEAALDFGNL